MPTIKNPYDNSQQDPSQISGITGVGSNPAGSIVGTSYTAPLGLSGATGGGVGSGPNGQFVNFQRFMDANRGAGQQAAGAVANSISQQAVNAQKAVGNARDQFAKDALAGAGVSGTSGSGSARVAAPAYTGPASSAADPNIDSAGLAQQTDAAAQAARASTTQPGLQALFQQQYAGSTPGGNALDAALGGAYGGTQFQALANKYGGLSSALGQGDAAALAAANASAQKQADAWNKQQQDYLNNWSQKYGSNYGGSGMGNGSTNTGNPKLHDVGWGFDNNPNKIVY